MYINAQKRELLHLNGFCQYYKNLHSGFNRSHHRLYSVIKTNGVTFEITNTATPDFIKNIIEKFSTNINRNEHNLQKWRFMFNKVFTKRKIRKIMKERK